MHFKPIPGFASISVPSMARPAPFFSRLFEHLETSGSCTVTSYGCAMGALSVSKVWPAAQQMIQSIRSREVGWLGRNEIHIQYIMILPSTSSQRWYGRHCGIWGLWIPNISKYAYRVHIQRHTMTGYQWIGYYRKRFDSTRLCIQGMHPHVLRWSDISPGA